MKHWFPIRFKHTKPKEVKIKSACDFKQLQTGCDIQYKVAAEGSALTLMFLVQEILHFLCNAVTMYNKQ